MLLLFLLNTQYSIFNVCWKFPFYSLERNRVYIPQTTIINSKEKMLYIPSLERNQISLLEKIESAGKSRFILKENGHIFQPKITGVEIRSLFIEKLVVFHPQSEKGENRTYSKTESCPISPSLEK